MKDIDILGRIVILMLLAALSTLPCAAATSPGIDRETALASERSRLAQATTAADSLPIIYDIFDLSLNRQRLDMADTLYLVAQRAADEHAILDAARHRASLHGENDSILLALRETVAGLHDSPDKAETMLFIEMFLLRNEFRDFSETQEGRQHISNLITSYISGFTADDHERALQIYAMCLYSEKATLTDMFASYLNVLDSHVRSMSLPNGAVTNHVLTQAAIALERNGYCEQSLELEQQLLDVMDDMATRYRAMGRRYRNYELNRYAVYRRMLICYPCMTDAQLDEARDSIAALAARNPQVAGDLERNPRALGFYHMGRHHYSQAIPYLQKSLLVPQNKMYERQILMALLEAARQTGNKAIELEASTALVDVLATSMERLQRDSFRELTLFKTVNELARQNHQLSDLMDKEVQHERQLTTTYIVAISLLLILLVLALYHLRKTRMLAKQLRTINDRLRQEQHELRHAQQELIIARDEAKAFSRIKSDFVTTMSHEVSGPLNTIVEYTRLIVDCIPAEKAQYMERFARTIEFNSEMILRLVHDTIDSEAIEKGAIAIDRKPVSIYKVAQRAIDTVFNGLHRDSDKKMVFNPSGRPDITVLTDGYRASQIIINLLSNADKFTEKGTLTLDFEPRPDEGVVLISVSDTGIGIAEGCEEIIFERFRKLDSSRQGAGLGLYIVRSLARMLGGKVWVDQSYRRGARFIFSLPIGYDGEKTNNQPSSPQTK